MLPIDLMVLKGLLIFVETGDNPENLFNHSQPIKYVERSYL